MKIKITQVVDIDQQSWADEYGIDLKDVRQDVKDHFSFLCQQIVDDLDLAAKPLATS